jgi:hypothetical protein
MEKPMDEEVRYPVEVLDSENEDDGTMPENVGQLEEAVVGHRIVSVEHLPKRDERYWDHDGLTITLDNGKQVRLRGSDNCCAYTDLEAFLLHPEKVDHIILGVGTTDRYTTWHIYADWGDVLELTVGWSCGNPFYYGYGFSITVEDIK